MARVLLAIGLLVSGSALAQDGAVEEEVRRLFDRYKVALLQGDGELASDLVDADTMKFFDDIKHLALAGDEESVKKRPFVDRLLIVTMRHELDSADLQQMGLQGLLQHAVEAGWIGKQSIAQLDIGEIEVSGDEATGVAITTGLQAPETEEPPLYRFVREEGVWKFRFHSLVQGINNLIGQFTAQMGTDEDDLIFLLVEQLSGRKVLPDVWSRERAE